MWEDQGKQRCCVTRWLLVNGVRFPQLFCQCRLSYYANLADIALDDPISDNPEMWWAFVRSVLIGSLAASWLPLLFTVGLALSSLPAGITDDGRLLPVLLLALSPLLVALAIVVPAMILVGLPVTWTLNRHGLESSDTYTAIGAVTGFAIPLILIAVFSFPWAAAWLSVLGGFSGVITARTWWKVSREQHGS